MPKDLLVAFIGSNFVVGYRNEVALYSSSVTYKDKHVDNYICYATAKIISGEILRTTATADKFIQWYGKNVNNIKEIYEPLQIQNKHQESLIDKGKRLSHPGTWK